MKYKADWASLGNYSVPQWFRDAKFGIFIHWGIYSVPAFDNEWYPRNMYIKGQPAYEHHVKTYGSQREFGYKDFISYFTAERWDPDEWASTFEGAGAKYVVLVAEHHDGFSLWDSDMNRWNAAKMGPKRDLVKELSEAERWEDEVVINYKHSAFPEGTAVLDVERGKLGQIRDLPWQTDTSICYDTWGYTAACKLRSAYSVITDLVDITSKNGNLLLNIAPRPDGTIPQEQKSVLNEVGRWLERNREAIYSTRPWARCCEGPTRPEAGEFREKEQKYTEKDLRFTSRGESVYAIGLSAPKDQVVIRSLGSNLADEVRTVDLLGRGQLKFEQNDEGLFVDIPPESANGPYSLRVKVGRQ